MARNRTTDRKPAIWREIIAHIMLPCSESDFYDSEWREWLERIRAGFESEKRRLEKVADGASDEYAEALADDYWQAKQITSNMRAALIVSVWARVERFLRILCRYCQIFGLPPLEDKPKIYHFAQYFRDHVKIDLRSITNYQTANAIRVLSNAFKHTDDRYVPDKFPLDETFAKEHGISEASGEIKYIKLPIEEMTLRAGEFCRELFSQTDAVLKGRTDAE